MNRDEINDKWKLPKTAIDTKELPSTRLDINNKSDKSLPVYRLTENTYFLYGNISILNERNRGFNGNAGFVVTEEGVVVIDSLGTPLLGERLISTIRNITDKPIKYLIVTHNHPDHAYGGSAFHELENVTIISHKGTETYNHSATLQQSVDYRNQLLGDDMKGFEPLKVDRFIKSDPYNKISIKLGASQFDVYNTGTHHSYGDLVVHQVKQDILWISDLAFNQRTTYMGDGDSAQILKSLEWLMTEFKDIKLMVPGHGSAQTPPFPMVDKTRRYVARMRKEMREAVENGIDLHSAVKQVEFEEWKDLPLYEQNQRANANFVYREMEKAFFEGF
ncbi:MAG: MBL fold metallo-hydrolase [Gammaproteobacteria bacterium]|nr:MBL fold metallo-hydrolase [Gammaproteobacteria bacterium]